MSEHSMRRARVFEAKNEGAHVLIGTVLLLILAGTVGFLGGMNIPFATYFGWGAAYAGVIGFIFAVYLYADRRMRGKYHHMIYSGVAGFAAFAVVEAFVPFGSAILNLASGSSFTGWLVNLLLGVLFILLLVVSFANVKRTDLR